MDEFWDNLGGWFKAQAEGRDHLHTKTRKDQAPACRRCDHA